MKLTDEILYIVEHALLDFDPEFDDVRECARRLIHKLAEHLKAQHR